MKYLLALAFLSLSTLSLFADTVFLFGTESFSWRSTSSIVVSRGGKEIALVEFYGAGFGPGGSIRVSGTELSLGTEVYIDGKAYTVDRVSKLD
jgi:hypothetical protein